ncbi:MAG: F0F1 ATP synthase subunit epsilon [Deltaproteobacteria bacterium]|nr:F0F1 ATP synthase subunit epsilon [Deltaproteobacteria bacterium]
MNSYTMHLRDVMKARDIVGVTCFVGETEDGAFGILPGHERAIIQLSYGLARYRQDGPDWQYLLLPGGVLYFQGEDMTIMSRHIFQSDDLGTALGEMENRLRAEEQSLENLKANLQHLEQEMMRKLWRLETGSGMK